MGRVVGAFRAVINGKPTALAGCDTTENICGLKCLRKDARLLHRECFAGGRMPTDPSHCQLFIPIDDPTPQPQAPRANGGASSNYRDYGFDEYAWNQRRYDPFEESAMGGHPDDYGDN